MYVGVIDTLILYIIQTEYWNFSELFSCIFSFSKRVRFCFPIDGAIHSLRHWFCYPSTIIWFIYFVQYHGSHSLRHWLQLSDWIPTLEATLALDEEQVRRVGDDSVGGPAVTRQLRLIRILMRDLLIGVSYKHKIA